MPKVNMENAYELIETYRTRYIEMLKTHYKPLLVQFLHDLMKELKITDYEIDTGMDISIYLYLRIFDSNFQISEPTMPYGNSNCAGSSSKNWYLSGYIESGQYTKEKNRVERNKSRKR